MAEPKSFMRQEIEEIPDAVARLLSDDGVWSDAAWQISAADPSMFATIARGSSDHAAGYLKYAIELSSGRPVASIAPSIVSIYGTHLDYRSAVAITISQSGKSPDIVASAASARDNGALVLALTNTTESPLAAAANIVIDLKAGPERSVAATKSFVNSIVAGLALIAAWRKDDGLAAALNDLPTRLCAAIVCDWSELFETLAGQESLYVLGRGPSMAIASEAALKFKETCGLHAEAYSSAEVAHGPARIVEGGYPVIALASRDAAEQSVVEMADRLAGQGARAFITSDKSSRAKPLAFAASGHPLTDALSLIVSFYGFVEALSRHRGLDPDRPPHLKKVTETV